MIRRLAYKNAGALFAAWALLIFCLCATPGQLIPSVSWLDLLSFDKWVHAGMFFVLSGLLIVVAAKRGMGHHVVIGGISLCVAYGGLLELMQAYCFSNRSADWQDFVANTFGCLMALLFSRRLKAVFVPAGDESTKETSLHKKEP